MPIGKYLSYKYLCNSVTKKVFTTLFTFSTVLSFQYSSHAESYSNRNIRVGIIQNISSLPVSTSFDGGFFTIKDGTFSKIIDIEASQFCTVVNKNGKLEISTKGKNYPVPSGKLYLRNYEQNDRYSPLVFGGNHWYRGYLEIFPSTKNNKAITVVNTLPLEEYLYGVVPSEMPSSWPVEALKVQAIAARTYVLSHLGQFGSEGFDVMPNTMSQMYEGVEVETPVTNQAVNETRGKVVTYRSKLISAYYSSGAGGMTESGYDAWGTDIPYLKPVKDYDQDSPRSVWYKNISNDELQNILKRDYKLDIGKIIKFQILELTDSGRVKLMRIEGTDGVANIEGKKWRLSAKLNSTLFRVEPVDPGTNIENNISVPTLFMFAGRGFGHGSGMSQWGARALAKSGRNSEDILRYYYQGTEINNVDEIMASK